MFSYCLYKGEVIVNLLEQKSKLSYSIIAALIILNSMALSLFMQTQIDSGKTINSTAKQGVLVQRIALVSNNYFDNLHKQELSEELQVLLEELKKNHSYLNALNNPIIKNVMYDASYQYDNLLENYENNVLKFLKTPTAKLLKIINYTNESLLITANTLVTLVADESDKKTEFISYFLLFSTMLILVVLLIIYKKITLFSIAKTQETIEELHQQKAFMSAILENSAHAIITTDTNGIITLFNKKAEVMLGYSADELVLLQTPAVFHKTEEVIQRAKMLSEEFNADIQPGFQVFVEKTNRDLENRDEWTYVHKDGSEITVKLSITKLIDTNNITTGYLGIAEDITSKKHNESMIKKYMKLIDKNIITSSTDVKGKITYTSEAFCKISGYTKDELIGQNHNIVRHPDMGKEIYEDLWAHLLEDKEWVGEIKNLKKDGSFYWVEANISPIYDFDGNKVGYTAIRQDITDKKLIETISITDGLTDIYNRRHFDHVFSKRLEANRDNQEYISFLIIDVDHFKQYNDTYGHQMGDAVLIEIAKTLKKSLKRQDDLCFRLGGEEFGVVFYTDNEDKAFTYANEIKDNIENLKIRHDGNSASEYVTASMGLICLKPNQVESEDLIYKMADKLLYEAKDTGRNKVIMKDVL